VFHRSIALVIGPTPPGTGVIAAAFCDTASKWEATPTFFVNGKKQSGEMSLAEIDKLVAPYL
jgi:hypothetical protein